MPHLVVAVTEDTFTAEVLEAPVPVIVDFWATWCGPCRQMAPAVDQLAAELAGQVKFVKVDIDTAPNLAGRYAIRSVPTLVVFRDGSPVTTITGAKPATAIRAHLTAVL